MKHLNTVFLFVIFALLGLVVAQPEYGVGSPPIVEDYDDILCPEELKHLNLCKHLPATP
uniref:Uncharacterized protein n=1 Tax=Anopheles funestus TaxID=62324 RepID=A0A4Y0BK08_ANOFN